MTKQFFTQAFVWGFVLWFVGYVLGIIFYMFVPHDLIGWFITPIGIALTLWVLFTKVKGVSMQRYLYISFAWVAIAIVLDYFLLVQVFKPADGYYKLDVYLYYLLTFSLPLLVGSYKLRRS